MKLIRSTPIHIALLGAVVFLLCFFTSIQAQSNIGGSIQQPNQTGVTTINTSAPLTGGGTGSSLTLGCPTCLTSGGGALWNNNQNPGGNLALTMGAYTNTFSTSSNTGTNNVWLFNDVSADTGSGGFFKVNCPNATTKTCFEVVSNGNSDTFPDLWVKDGQIGIGTNTVPAGVGLTVNGNVNLYENGGITATASIIAGSDIGCGVSAYTVSGNLTLPDGLCSVLLGGSTSATITMDSNPAIGIILILKNVSSTATYTLAGLWSGEGTVTIAPGHSKILNYNNTNVQASNWYVVGAY